LPNLALPTELAGVGLLLMVLLMVRLEGRWRRR
jgi:hypothetical protein